MCRSNTINRHHYALENSTIVVRTTVQRV